MYSLARFQKTLSCLLAAALAAQPVAGFSCGCNSDTAASGTQPAKPQCSCRCAGSTHGCCCCCGAAHPKPVDSKPTRSCCQHNANRDKAPSPERVCMCGSGAPVAPQSVPTERNRTDDVTASVLYALAVTADVPAIHQEGRGVNLPTEFASASEHCIALCRLLI